MPHQVAISLAFLRAALQPKAMYTARGRSNDLFLQKTTHLCKGTQHVMKFCIQTCLIKFGRRYHLDPALNETIEIRVPCCLLEFANSCQKSLLDFSRHLSKTTANHRAIGQIIELALHLLDANFAIDID